MLPIGMPSFGCVATVVLAGSSVVGWVDRASVGTLITVSLSATGVGVAGTVVGVDVGSRGSTGSNVGAGAGSAPHATRHVTVSITTIICLYDIVHLGRKNQEPRTGISDE